jgi:AcrR family transcriptional regulator
MPRVVDREARRAELVSAAAAVFAERGLATATVSDIVSAAGVAQGTFYLYFDSKDDVVLAVAERFGDRMLEAIERAVAASHESAVAKLLALRDVLGDAAALESAAELVDTLHDPKNVAIHDRLSDHLAPRLVAIVQRVIEQGVAEGTFSVPDVHAAAWFVLGGLRSVELSQVPRAQLSASLETATTLVLRALGCTEEAP